MLIVVPEAFFQSNPPVTTSAGRRTALHSCHSAFARAGRQAGINDTFTDSVPLATRSSPFWNSVSGSWCEQILSIGSTPDSSILIAGGQQYGPRWAPSTSSSLSSLMMLQSTETSLPKTPYSTY